LWQMTLFPTFRRNVLKVEAEITSETQHYISPLQGAYTPKHLPVLQGTRLIVLAGTIGCGTDDSEFESLQRREVYFFSTKSVVALGPLQPAMVWVPGFFPGGYSGRGLKLTTCVIVVSRLRMSGVKRLLPTLRLHGVDWGKYFFYAYLS
jgi:hypothetical protein